MNNITAYFQIYFAYLLYLLSAITFFDYMYSLTIPDTVTAIENAFGKLIILVFMLVMAKFSRAAGKARLQRHNEENTENPQHQAGQDDSPPHE